MNVYLVTFHIKGKKYQEEVRATTGGDARKLIKSRYPEASILNVLDVARKTYV